MWQITEHIKWGQKIEFEFQGFTELANQLRMYVDLMKLSKSKRYRILIEEVI